MFPKKTRRPLSWPHGFDFSRDVPLLGMANSKASRPRQPVPRQQRLKYSPLSLSPALAERHRLERLRAPSLSGPIAPKVHAAFSWDDSFDEFAEREGLNLVEVVQRSTGSV